MTQPREKLYVRRNKRMELNSYLKFPLIVRSQFPWGVGMEIKPKIGEFG